MCYGGWLFFVVASLCCSLGVLLMVAVRSKRLCATVRRDPAFVVQCQ